MLAYYLHNLSPFIWEFRPGFGLRWYGFAYVFAFFCGYRLYLRLAERGYSELKPAQVADFITWAALFGVLIGGRVGWIIFYGLQQDHTGEPWWWPFKVWSGGMASHGGILGLVFFTFWYSRRHRISWTSIGDSLCVVAPVGLFLVRCANFINGELYGRIASVPWAVQFPNELYENADLQKVIFPDSAPGDLDVQLANLIEAARHDPAAKQILRDHLPSRHPSQLYEALLEGAVLFAILWFLRTRTRQPRGVITGVFFICYAVLRIVGEMFRVPDPAWAMGALSAGQFLSLFLILIGAAFIVWGKLNPHYERAVVEKH